MAQPFFSTTRMKIVVTKKHKEVSVKRNMAFILEGEIRSFLYTKWRGKGRKLKEEAYFWDLIRLKVERVKMFLNFWGSK